ncbi:ABC transporter ATP-binding protein/permease [Verrucomicrobium sp. BvORR034]|uniref:ABC transporter ATP-binding protein/permease n=1 Tax=Verrucomicrobium sp. BvORR034 TaxID=1396418 RepID=UPI0009DF8C83|nr:ABC transporter ATP-binding protein/permease [Verrucomicrobium sp. BvORR034]
MGTPNDKGSGAEENSQTKPPLGRTLRQFWIITKAFFGSKSRRKARGFLAVLLTLSLAVGGVQVLMSYAGRDFMNDIARKDGVAYWRSLGWYLATFALAVPIGTYYRWTEERLALLWREWLTQHLIKRYFNNRAYYRLRSSPNVDNPDQRISEDVRNFTVSTLSFLLILLNSLVTLIAFTGVLWTISGTLVTILFAYAAVGTLASILIGRPLVRLSFMQYQKEADLRYGLVRVRDNAESIAFYRGEKREHLDLIERLARVVVNTRNTIFWNRNLGFFTNTFNYASLVLPLVIVAPMYIRGQVEFGVITQASGAFAQVLAAVTLIVTQFGVLSAYLAGVQRLAGLWENLDEHDAEEERIEKEAQLEVEDDSRLVKLEDVTVRTPNGDRDLVTDLSFVLKRKQSLLIMGDSGTGKSSVLRTIAGLWSSGSGSLERPALNDLMFLPQRPYMIQGTLRDQLLYPYPQLGLSDEEISAVMEKVNLSDIFARVDNDLNRIVDWTNVLSIGEQQRVAFARLFLRRPKFAFLDEATSALDEDNQEHLYELLRKSGIAYISVGHRNTLIRHHDHMLHLDPSGRWEIKSAAELAKKPAEK